MGQLIRQIKKKNGLIRRFAEEEDAVGVVEIILILVVLIGLVIIFKEQLTELVQSILSKIAKQSNSTAHESAADAENMDMHRKIPRIG